MQEAVFRIRKIFFFTDPYPDFTDQYSDSDPTHLLVIFNKKTLLKHYKILKGK